MSACVLFRLHYCHSLHAYQLLSNLFNKFKIQQPNSSTKHEKLIIVLLSSNNSIGFLFLKEFSTKSLVCVITFSQVLLPIICQNFLPCTFRPEFFDRLRTQENLLSVQRVEITTEKGTGGGLLECLHLKFGMICHFHFAIASHSLLSSQT